MKKAQRVRAVQVVRTVINEWDPYGLLKIGCPKDEFDSEVASIVSQIPRIDSPIAAAHAISRVFGDAFSDTNYFSRDNCADVGAKLYRALAESRLISVQR
jgi:hypothetical protein